MSEQRDGIHLGDVPIDSVETVWPFVEAFVSDACLHSDGDFEASDILATLHSGERMLWIAHDNVEILMGLVVEVFDTPRHRVCLIVAAGGHPRVPWDWIAGVIEQFAADRGCQKVRIVGRKGWGRKLASYRITSTTLSKDIGA